MGGVFPQLRGVRWSQSHWISALKAACALERRTFCFVSGRCHGAEATAGATLRRAAGCSTLLFFTPGPSRTWGPAVPTFYQHRKASFLLPVGTRGRGAQGTSEAWGLSAGGTSALPRGVVRRLLQCVALRGSLSWGEVLNRQQGPSFCFWTKLLGPAGDSDLTPPR